MDDDGDSDRDDGKDDGDDDGDVASIARRLGLVSR